MNKNFVNKLAFPRNASSTELDSGNPLGACLQTPAPVLDKNSGPMGHAGVLPVPLRAKNRFKFLFSKRVFKGCLLAWSFVAF